MSDRLLKESDVIEAFKGRESLIHDVYTATAIIRSVPSADRPQGEWSIDSVDEIELSYGGTAYEPVYKCSHCGRTTESYVRFDEPLMPEDADFPKFCGWCGAQMKGADDES